MLRLIAGFERPDRGLIEVGGKIVSGERINLPPEERRVGMVFQDYAIFPHLNVKDNVAFGIDRNQNAQTLTTDLLELVGLEGRENQMPHELSGGQQQRVALARALAPNPAVLLLDEPFSNLDTSLRIQVRAEVRKTLTRKKVTAIFVTHDQEEALFIGDLVAVMDEGSLIQIGTPEEIFHFPATRFVAEFMGQTDFLPGIVTSTGIETAIGTLSQELGLATGSQVEVSIRPDDIYLTASKKRTNGYIENINFLGIANIYSIALNNGAKVHSWQPHTVSIAPGESVWVELRPGHSLTCFYQGKAVGQ
jgi:iron(III) transport system ATP-binding protein